MIVRVDANSPVPPYEQLREQIAGMVVSGTLPAGRQLPPIRQLAADLALAPGTVARAYRELEAAGLVVSRGRRGTRVSDQPRSPYPAAEVDRLLAEAARRFAAVVRQLDVPPETALAAARVAMDGIDVSPGDVAPDPTVER